MRRRIRLLHLVNRPPWELDRARRAAERSAERAAKHAVDRILWEGPPSGSRIDPKAWADWHRHGWLVCPGSKDRTCNDPSCGIGVTCHAMKAIGLARDGSALARRLRPTCGAKNRRGQPCAVRVEPGKRRCRFHGGLSTGPRTAKGKARIAEAQRRRWALRPSSGR